MHLFLAMLAAPLTSQPLMPAQASSTPLRQLLSHRQLAQAYCDAVGCCDRGCSHADRSKQTQATDADDGSVDPLCDADMSVFSTVNNCNQLKSAWDTLCFSMCTGGGGGGGTTGGGGDDDDDDDAPPPSTSATLLGRCC